MADVAGNWIDLLGSFGGSAISGVASYSGSKKAQKRAQAFNAQQAQLARDFTERLVRNAHTYEVEDLRNAGLNPILSANGGASAPSGASASVSPNGTINMDNPYTSWVNTQTAKAQMQQARNQASLLSKQEKLVDSQKKNQDIVNSFLPEQIRAGIANQNANTGQLGALTEKTNKETDNIYPANLEQFIIKYAEQLGYKLEKENENKPEDDEYPRTPNGRLRIRPWVNPQRLKFRR